MGPEKRGEITIKKVTGLRIFAGIVIALVVAAIGAGLYLSGSPSTERSRQFDTRRLNDLQTIAGAVDSFYSQNYRLPQNLDVLVAAGGGKESYLVGSLSDPQPDRGGYEYSPMGQSTYELCAMFDLPSEKAETQNLKQPPPPTETAPMAEPAALVTTPNVKSQLRTWEHGAGHSCFQLDATYSMSSVTCGLTMPCQTSQTCAALPNNMGTKCVPQGHECEAAGCPEKCAVSTDYPAQVTCAAVLPAAKPSECKLMQDEKTGQIDCFGCARGICNDPPSRGWQEYTAPKEPGYMGIPYACFESDAGCALAQ
jgi:hypothetical protein